MAKKVPVKTTKTTDKNSVTEHVEITGLVLIGISLFMFCALFGFSVGSIGTFTGRVLRYAMGIGAWLLPIYLCVMGLGYIIKHERMVLSKKFFSILLILLSLLSLYHYVVVPDGQEIMPEYLPIGGGLLGGTIVFLLKKVLGNAGSLIALLVTTLTGIVLTGKFSLSQSLQKAGQGVKNSAVTAAHKLEDFNERRKERNSFYNQAEDEVPPKSKQKALNFNDMLEDDPKDIVQPIFKFKPEEIDNKPEPAAPQASAPKEKEEVKVYKPVLPPTREPGDTSYVNPPFSLLHPEMKMNKKDARAEISTQSAIIEQTLVDFGVRATLVDVTKGPSVTRFELAPAPGVKVNKIQNLADDIALKLAVSSVRIEPIVGKAAIGLEVPSKATEAVSFRSVVDCDTVRNAKGKLCVGLGKDISGNVIVADLSKMPHLLVAGSTGSGKSVCINTIIASLLFRATPDEVKLILVDPKVVELTNYNGIPHLLSPVVTGPKQAASALHWAVVEMERRYTLFAHTSVRKIDDYNEVAEEKLPFIVIIIDELSDLMMVAAVDVEDAILRLAQKARAAGIHLIVATQRPSVDVITGIVKANIPSRIAFAVSSQIDSRTILDESGAEKLLGKGDMLFNPLGAQKPIRVQGAYIADDELARVLNFIKAQNIPQQIEEEVTTQELNGAKKNGNNGDSDGNTSDLDELFEDAVRLVMDTQQASSSMLQRKFRIGYTRAARLVDTMEEQGIVSAADGSKPRTLIMSPAVIEEKFFSPKEEAPQNE